MTEPLFPYLPDQREGPITVDGFTLVLCPACDGVGITGTHPSDGKHCRTCGGGGQVLVRLC